MNYLLHVIVMFDIYAMIALSVNLVFGYCGMLTLAHAAYFILGGYTYAITSIGLGWPFPAAAAAAAGVGGGASIAISVPGWRLKNDLFVLVTLAVGLTFAGAMTNWTDLSSPIASWRNLTNGPLGISGIPKPAVFGLRAATPPAMAMLATTMAAATALVLWRLKSSPWGRALIAMRDDELAARAVGKHTRLLTLQAFAVSCALAAVAGALYASYIGFLEPGSASVDESILMLSMVIVGGAGNVSGPLAGALLLTLLPEVIRLFGVPESIAANMRVGLYGLLLIVMMQWRPQGILGRYRVS